MMKTLFLLLLFCHVVSPVTHSLHFLYTGVFGDQKWPEFVGVAMVDGAEVIYCDSNISRAEPKQDWMTKALEHDPKHMDWFTEECHAGHRSFNAMMKTLMESFDQTGGVHIYQRMFGCELDDETEEVNGYNQFGYDGEDFMKPQALITKHKWDTDKAALAHIKSLLTQLCPEWLKMFVNSGKSSLLRTELPSVSLLQKTPSSPVSCHATGFYPHRAVMFWRKDGEELYEDVDQGEILPNHDETFQMRVDLDISSVTPEDWRRYDCVFQLSGVKEDVVTRLDKAEIRTNWGNIGIRKDEGGQQILNSTISVVLRVWKEPSFYKGNKYIYFCQIKIQKCKENTNWLMRLNLSLKRLDLQLPGLVPPHRKQEAPCLNNF
uniref:Ig-like domain-containing protein n=1 Tax=Seriola lalandi dorsalis TaxID=1841481 RepID=A0A3B4Y1X9_SERLL